MTRGLAASILYALALFGCSKDREQIGATIAVDDVSLDVHQGEIFGLIGPNGAGKTTLFNCINGVYRPQLGSIKLQGHELVGAKPAATANRGIARTFQNLGLFTNLDVVDNLMLGRHTQMKTGFLAGMLWFGRARSEEIANRRRVEEIIDLDLAYAPPFSSVWDPVAIAARQAAHHRQPGAVRDRHRRRARLFLGQRPDPVAGPRNAADLHPAPRSAGDAAGTGSGAADPAPAGDVLSGMGWPPPPPHPSPQGGGCRSGVWHHPVPPTGRHLPPYGGGWEGGQRARRTPSLRTPCPVHRRPLAISE